MKRNISASSTIVKGLIPLVAVVLAMLMGMILIALLGQDVGKAIGYFVQGSLGSPIKIADTLTKFAPITFTALAYAIAYRCGLINIGAEGQFYMGGLVSGLAAIYITGLPMFVHIPIVIILGFIAGGLWGFIAGWLKVTFGANEIITTIMLNYIALFLVNYLIGYDGPFNDGSGNPQSLAFQETAKLSRGFIIPKSDLTIAFLIAILAIIFYWVFFYKMKRGYEMRVTGLNPTAAEYAGMKVKSNALLSMFMAGGFGGLSGAFELIGGQSRILPSFSSGYGFDGIAVALLGQLHPVGIGLSAFLFAVLKSGGLAMGSKGAISPYIVNVIQAFVIIFVVASVFIQQDMEKRKLIKSSKLTDKGA